MCAEKCTHTFRHLNPVKDRLTSQWSGTAQQPSCCDWTDVYFTKRWRLTSEEGQSEAARRGRKKDFKKARAEATLSCRSQKVRLEEKREGNWKKGKARQGEKGVETNRGEIRSKCDWALNWDEGHVTRWQMTSGMTDCEVYRNEQCRQGEKGETEGDEYRRTWWLDHRKDK